MEVINQVDVPVVVGTTQKFYVWKYLQKAFRNTSLATLSRLRAANCLLFEASKSCEQVLSNKFPHAFQTPIWLVLKDENIRQRIDRDSLGSVKDLVLSALRSLKRKATCPEIVNTLQLLHPNVHECLSMKIMRSRLTSCSTGNFNSESKHFSEK